MYHFIGMNGIGMSGLARLLLKQKISVSGSDMGAVSKELEGLGAKCAQGHCPRNIPEGATVVYSSAVKEENIEYQHAVQNGHPLLHRSELLAKLTESKFSIAVSGTHGKTTTSALLAHLTKEAGLQPSFMVGGVLANYNANAEFGTGKHFVFEADESDGTFLNYHPSAAIVTNMGFDHIDRYNSPKDVEDAFKQFISQVKGILLWCCDDAGLASLSPKGISYGFKESADARLSNFRQKGLTLLYDLSYLGKVYKDVEVSMPGRHSALNSAAAFVMARAFGADENLLRKALVNFKGIGRRLEKRTEVRGVTVYDDYAHHPTEVQATLKALRDAAGPRRIIALFEPHRYTRFNALFEEFQTSFKDADLTIITDVHSAGEKQFGKSVQEFNADYIPRDELLKTLKPMLLPHDIVITLGAGGITNFSKDLANALEREAPRKLTVAVAYGGMSAEHEISILSKEHVVASLQRDLYEVREVEITREGAWQVEGIECSPTDALENVDIVFPVFHGPFGEDGTVQGLFELLKIPYVGCCYRSAAIAMDKGITKKLAEYHGIATAPFSVLTKQQWLKGDGVQKNLSLPVFVKAAHLGSSIGVIKVEYWKDLDLALEEAFNVDDSVVIEQAIFGREIEFAVLGNDPVVVFPPGEVLTGGKFYDFASKYLEGGMQTTCTPDLSQDAVDEGRALAKRAFEACSCKGMARIDFFYDKEGKFWLNEINPIPGFTEISLYPKICAANGLTGEKLVDQLITLAMQRMRDAVK